MHSTQCAKSALLSNSGRITMSCQKVSKSRLQCDEGWLEASGEGFETTRCYTDVLLSSKRTPPAPLDLRGGQNSCTGLQPVPNAGGICHTCTSVSFLSCSDSYYVWIHVGCVGVSDLDYPLMVIDITSLNKWPCARLGCWPSCQNILPWWRESWPFGKPLSLAAQDIGKHRFLMIPSTSQTSGILKGHASKRLAAHRLLSPPGSSWFPWIMKLAVQLIGPKHWAPWMNKLQGLHSNFASCTKGTQRWGSGLGNWPYLLQS